jgi:hypothetical protein
MMTTLARNCKNMPLEKVYSILQTKLQQTIKLENYKKRNKKIVLDNCFVVLYTVVKIILDYFLLAIFFPISIVNIF